MTDSLPTPALLLDRMRLDLNIARMATQMARLGVPLRPHVKTAKSIEVVRRAFGGGVGPITVSTLAEARHFAAAGFRDILYAVGIAPAKLHEVAALRRDGVDLAVILDNAEAARAVACYSDPIPVLLEIDSDNHRAGIAPDDALLIEVAEALGPDRLRGVMTHAGGSYESRGEVALRAMARRERDALVEAADRLEARGLPCAVRSAGSTPTALFAQDAAGLTEYRAGVYMFHDLVMAGLAVCAVDDIAISVLTTVIGHQRHKGWILVDAGWTALSRDRGTQQQDADQGYGVVCDRDGNVHQDLLVVSANQEHGILAMRPGAAGPPPELPVGTQLRILPNHACATAAQHDRYHVLAGGLLDSQWPRFGGW